MARLIAKELKPYADILIGEYQCDFKAGLSTMNQIFDIGNILENFYEQRN